MAEVKALRPASEADALEIIRRAGSVESVTALVAMLGWERTKTQRWLARRQRTGDIVGNKREERPPMKWDHVDLNSRVWTIPATKTDAEHRVPLSDAALVVLKCMAAVLRSELVFLGQRAGKPISENVMRRMLEDVGRADITVHGFRSTFRTWAAERTNFPWHVCETALAHTVGDETERDQRGDLFEKRRRMMTAWADYCAAKAPGVARNVRALRTQCLSWCCFMRINCRSAVCPGVL